MTLIRLVLVPILLAAVLGGCGGAASPAAPATSTPAATTAAAATPPTATAPTAATATSAPAAAPTNTPTLVPTASPTSAPTATATAIPERASLDQAAAEQATSALPKVITGLNQSPGNTGLVSFQTFETDAKPDDMTAVKGAGIGDMTQTVYTNPAGRQGVYQLRIGIAPLAAGADSAKALDAATKMAGDLVTTTTTSPFDVQSSASLKDLFDAGSHIDGVLRSQSGDATLLVDIFRRKNVVVWIFTSYLPGADGKATEQFADEAVGKALQGAFRSQPAAPVAGVISLAQAPLLMLQPAQVAGLNQDPNTGWWVPSHLVGAAGDPLVAAGNRGAYSSRYSVRTCSALCAVASTYYLFASADAAKAALPVLINADKAQFPNSSVNPATGVAPDAVAISSAGSLKSVYTVWQFKNGLNEVFVFYAAAKDSDLAVFIDAVKKNEAAVP